MPSYKPTNDAPRNPHCGTNAGHIDNGYTHKASISWRRRAANS
ncbi:MAG: hypothetical protein ACJARY_000748 [Candidatus Azotimanducaceae bacterium]|jgi:hypothetical protein